VAGQITVTMTGFASLADYQSAIQAVTFRNSSQQPNPQDRLIEVTVNDGILDSIVGRTTINVVPVNDAPVLANAVGNKGATEDSPFTFVVPANTFADVDVGDTLTLTATLANGSPLPAWLSFDPSTRTFSGTPKNENVGTLSIRVTAKDGANATASSTFDLDISNTNDSPVATTDAAAGHENQVLTIDVLANDEDADLGHEFTLLSVSAPVGQGTAAVVGNKLVFNPGKAFDGLAVDEATTVELTYQMRDQHGATSSSTVTVTVTGTNDRPVARGDWAKLWEDGTKLGSVLTNDGDVDGDTLTVASVGGQVVSDTGPTLIKGLYGTLTIASDGTYSYTADTGRANDLITGETGTDTFTYQMSDGGLLDEAVLTFTVKGSNEVLIGTDQANRLVGGRGADYLCGLEGKDTLKGGEGADRFDFNSVQEMGLWKTADRIVDFQTGLDRIDLRTIDANEGRRGNQNFAWVDAADLGAAFTGKAGQLRFVDGRLEGDTDGDGRADFHIKVLHTLAAADVIC
jgi:VCBS repeat-containing protein